MGENEEVLAEETSATTEAPAETSPPADEPETATIEE